jgi:hypothetical protein
MSLEKQIETPRSSPCPHPPKKKYEKYDIFNFLKLVVSQKIMKGVAFWGEANRMD